MTTEWISATGTHHEERQHVFPAESPKVQCSVMASAAPCTSRRTDGSPNQLVRVFWVATASSSTVQCNASRA
jgi:hypothetical protein